MRKVEQLKKIVIALLFVPVFSMGQSLPWTQASATACYQGKSTKSELLEAVACLKSNPAAGSAIIKEFRKAKSELPAVDAEVTAALNDLERQKNSRLYISYFSDNKSPKLMLVESITLGGQRTQDVFDLAALDIKFTHTSAMLGKDKTVEWKQVRSFHYQQSGNVRGIGKLLTTLVDNTQFIDKSYQGRYPLKEHESGDYWRAITQFNGTTYPGKNKNDYLRLGQDDLSSYEVTFLTEEDGKQQVAKFEEAILAQQKEKEQAERVAAEKFRISSEKETERKAKLLAEMSSAKRGSEDSCKRLEFGTYMVKLDPDSVDIDCQFGGKINLTDLKSAGWLIVNKQKDSEGIVREYYIRKAR